MIVVGVRVTRISTDGCAVRVQFVVGLHSVPHLFNSNFYQLTLRASNGRVLFFFAFISAPQERCTSRGRVGGGSVNTCAVYLPCVAVGCSCTVWFVLCGGAVCPRYCCAVSRQKCYPQGLSTVWRTYTHVIWQSRIEVLPRFNLRVLQKNSCNYRLSRPLKPRVSS